jgi:hypothetical protein
MAAPPLPPASLPAAAPLLPSLLVLAALLDRDRGAPLLLLVLVVVLS